MTARWGTPSKLPCGSIPVARFHLKAQVRSSGGQRPSRGQDARPSCVLRARWLAVLPVLAWGATDHLLPGELVESVGNLVLAGMTAVQVDQRGEPWSGPSGPSARAVSPR